MSPKYDKVGIGLTNNSYCDENEMKHIMSAGLISFSMTLLKSTNHSPLPVYFGCESLDRGTKVLITVSKL